MSMVGGGREREGEGRGRGKGEGGGGGREREGEGEERGREKRGGGGREGEGEGPSFGRYTKTSSRPTVVDILKEYMCMLVFSFWLSILALPPARHDCTLPLLRMLWGPFLFVLCTGPTCLCKQRFINFVIVGILFLIGVVMAVICHHFIVDNCQESTWYPHLRILSHDTIKGGEFRSCNSKASVSWLDDIGIHSPIIVAFAISCEQVHLYHNTASRNDSFGALRDTRKPMYNSSVHSSYFANGLSGQISIRANITEHALVAVCVFTNETVYEDFLNITGCRLEGCVTMLESERGTAHNVTHVNYTLPSYYFVALQVCGAVSSLSYNFSTTRSYYNRSDYPQARGCVISSTNPSCEITHSGNPPCEFIMLFAYSDRTPSFHSLTITGEEKIIDKRRATASLALYITSSLINSLAIVLLIISVWKCTRRN
jgi:hypothetical protein